MRAATFLLALAVVLPSAFATPSVTQPVAASKWQGGTDETVSWIEDPSNPTPSLKDYGPCKVSIYVGNSQQQTSLQLIDDSVDVSQVNQITFKPDPKIGPDSDQYFIRIESISLKDPKNPQFPALAFSAKFTLSGMTGNFTDAIVQQIQGASSLPLSPSGPTSSISSRISTSSVPPKSSGTPTSSRPASSTGSTQGNTSGALGLTTGKFLTGVVAATVGLVMML